MYPLQNLREKQFHLQVQQGMKLNSRILGPLSNLPYDLTLPPWSQSLTSGWTDASPSGTGADAQVRSYSNRKHKIGHCGITSTDQRCFQGSEGHDVRVLCSPWLVRSSAIIERRYQTPKDIEHTGTVTTKSFNSQSANGTDYSSNVRFLVLSCSTLVFTQDL